MSNEIATLGDLVDVPTGAQLVGIKESTLRKWIYTRKIRSYKVGDLVRLTRADLAGLLQLQA